MTTIDDMRALGRALLTQDGRCTSHPVYCVQVVDRVYGLHADYTDDFVWLDEDGNELDDDLASTLDSMDDEVTTEDGTWVRTGTYDRCTTVQSFFTYDAACTYIERNRHNLKSPRIYVASAHNNPEWQSIRAFLMSLVSEDSDEV